MKTSKLAAVAAMGLSLGGATSAFAQETTTEPMETAVRPIVTPKGKISVFANLGLGLSAELAPDVGGPGKPISINPDVFYGVAPKLEVGVAHSGYNLDGFWGDTTLLGIFGTGVCVTGEEGLCDSVYNGPVGVLARYAIMETSDLGLAADAGPVIRRIDSNGPADGGDLLMGLKVGARGRWMKDKLSVGFAPNITIGLNSRDGNGDFLAVPVDVMFAVNDKIEVGGQTGIEGELDNFGDNYAIPIGVGGMFMINDKMSVGGAFVLHRIAGGSDADAGDLRSLQVFFTWHN